MSGRILREARAQQAELDEEAAPPAAAALAAGGARGLVAAAAKGLRDSDSDEDDDFSGAWVRLSVAALAGNACYAARLPACCARPRRQPPPAPWQQRSPARLVLPAAPPPADGYAPSEGGYEWEDEIEVSPEDEAALAAFMAPDAGARPAPGTPACPLACLQAARAPDRRPLCWHGARRCRRRSRRHPLSPRPAPPRCAPIPSTPQPTTGSARWRTWCWTRSGRSRRRRGWQRCPGARGRGCCVGVRAGCVRVCRSCVPQAWVGPAPGSSWGVRGSADAVPCAACTASRSPCVRQGQPRSAGRLPTTPKWRTATAEPRAARAPTGRAAPPPRRRARAPPTSRSHPASIHACTLPPRGCLQPRPEPPALTPAAAAFRCQHLPHCLLPAPAPTRPRVPPPQGGRGGRAPDPWRPGPQGGGGVPGRGQGAVPLHRRQGAGRPPRGG